MRNHQQTSLGILLINQTWFAAELREFGHRVVTAGWAHDGYDIRFERLTELNDLLARLPADFYLDRIIYLDDSYSVSVLGLQEIPVPSLFYSIDAHHHWQWHAWFASLFDQVFVAQRDYLPLFRNINPELDDSHLVWAPLWAPVFFEPQAIKDIEVSFRGTLDPSLHPERAAFFEELGRLVPLDAGSGPYGDVYPRSKIVVNQSVGTDVNFRVFEALMCGALLVTPRLENGQPELFENGKHIMTYPRGDAAAAAKIIRTMLQDDAARERIAACGRAEVVKRHRAWVRAEELEQALLELPFKSKPRRYFVAAFSALHGLGTFAPAFSCDTDELKAYRDTLIKRAKQNLLRSLLENEPIDEEFRAMALLCKCYLEIVSSREELLEFSSRMRKACPGDLMLSLSYVEDLLALGQKDEAVRVANEVSHSPEELVASVPIILGAARERVLSSMRPAE